MKMARQVCLALEVQFLSNRESCVLQLDARFRDFKQGDLSVSDYYCQMKGMADNLRALGEIITDHLLVLNLLQGLNKRFDHMKIFIKRSQSFLSFHTIRNDLELKEIKLDNSVAQGQASAPLGGGCPPQQQPPCPPQQELPSPPVAPCPPVPTPDNGGKGKGKGKDKDKEKVRTMTLAAVTTTTGIPTPQRSPPTIPGLTPSQCG
jgi:hypothetical protein